MIREERCGAFWNRIAGHPEVSPHVFLTGVAVDLTEVVTRPNVIPLASEHGGFLFSRLDACGRVYELHTLYTPEGWGREVLSAAKEAFSQVFSTAQVVATYEVDGWWRSRPPRSFGFVQAGDFAPVPGISARLATWVLTKAAWEQSPACRRVQCH